MSEEDKEPECKEEIEEPKLNKWDIIFKELSSALFPLVASIAAAITLSTFFFDSSPFLGARSQLSESEKMFVYLMDGTKKNLFSEEYFNTAFNHFDRKSEGEIAKYGRVETMEDYVVFLNTKLKSQEKVNIESVSQLLSKLREVEPFSALPAEERRLMDQLQFLVSNKENSQPIIQTLNELKQVILARHKEYQRIEGQNSWSLPLSFIGAFLTLVFGIWTTILSIRQSRSRYSIRYKGSEGEWIRHSADGKIIRRY